MSNRSEYASNRLTASQMNRLRYIAACGPVFRDGVDEHLERMQLVRPFNGMPSVVEVTCDAEQTVADEPPGEHRHDGSVAMLLDACQATLRAFSPADWCHHGYGCDDCDGCHQHQQLTSAVAKVSGVAPEIAKRVTA